VASAIDWDGLDALEVGSGRGGGAAYVKEAFNPASLVGIDLTPHAVAFCSQHHSAEELYFARAHAQSLPFATGSLDVVINVESSGHYLRIERFLSEVVRVLRPRGWFLCADLRHKRNLVAWRDQLASTGLQLVEEQDITPNVVRALELDSSRKRLLIDQHVPRLLRGVFGKFAGMSGAGLARGAPQPGDRIYLNFVLRKSAPA
jgi:SAM-dependent methyltransferase